MRENITIMKQELDDTKKGKGIKNKNELLEICGTTF